MEQESLLAKPEGKEQMDRSENREHTAAWVEALREHQPE